VSVQLGGGGFVTVTVALVHAPVPAEFTPWTEYVKLPFVGNVPVPPFAENVGAPGGFDQLMEVAFVHDAVSVELCPL
jgi:hypothetical protein